MNAPSRIDTARLLLTPPQAADAAELFERYASDEDVVRFVGWPRHRSLADTMAFLTFSAAEWASRPAGPYVIRSRTDGRLLGGTGLSFDGPGEAMTGYVLAQDAWGQGYASEALAAMVALAAQLGVRRLYALCHPAHLASRRVLEKCGFVVDRAGARHMEFPNLAPGVSQPAVCYARSPAAIASPKGDSIMSEDRALMIEAHYLADAVAQMRRLKEHADKAVTQVDDAAFFGTIDPDANSIAIIMKHVAGNMQSRWTDFLTSDGEKPDRHRDLEFEVEGADTRAKVMAAWEAGWDLTLKTVGALTPADLGKTVRIRGEALGVIHAINRQMTHYAEHAGQIVLLAKHFAGSNWKTLSIPKRKP